MPLEISSLLHGRYRIVDILGKGGMGAVYRAIDESLGVNVAVKENLIEDEEASRQFRREATILANLRHTNLPRVTDHFEIAGQGQYLIMDYVEGEDLRQRMERTGVLDEKEVILIGVAMCEALAYLHSQTPVILHRDIKPGNVKVTPNGQVSLVDFGLAKIVQGSQETTTGARGLTPGYSPPEQYGSARTEPRSDIYSLSATLYAVLAGDQPEDALAIMIGQAQLTKLRDRNPKVSKKLAAVIEKALSPEGKDRYQTAAEFKQALLDASDTVSRKVAEGAVTVEPAPMESGLDTMVSGSASAGPTVVSGSNAEIAQPGRRSPGLMFGMIGMALVVIIGGLWLGRGAISDLLSSSGNNPPVTTQNIPAATNDVGGGSAATATTGNAAAADTETPLPEEPTETLPAAATAVGGGAQIAFASMRNGAPQIYLLDLPSGEITQLTDINGGACQPTWSPSGMQLVFISPCNANKESYPGSGLFIMNADGSGLSPLPSSPAGDFDPDWSPVEDKIVFTSLREGGRPNIFVMDLANRAAINLSNTVAHDYQPSWSPDGSLILFVTTRAGPTQIWFMDPSGRPWDVFSRSNTLSNTDPFWSPDGLLVLFTQFTGGSSNRPQLIGAPWQEGGPERGFNEVQIIESNAGVREAEYSPDGFWLVFVSAQEPGNFDIFIARSTGAGIERVTTDGAADFDPAWRPDPPGP